MVDVRFRISLERVNGAQIRAFFQKDGSSEVRNSVTVVFRLLPNSRKFPKRDWQGRFFLIDF